LIWDLVFSEIKQTAEKDLLELFGKTSQENQLALTKKYGTLITTSPVKIIQTTETSGQKIKKNRRDSEQRNKDLLGTEKVLPLPIKEFLCQKIRRIN
jgi:hypothetical protein